MKRSKIINELAHYLKLWYADSTRNKERAKHLLDVLESHGMTPPSYDREYNPLPSKKAYVTIREWEAETDV